MEEAEERGKDWRYSGKEEVKDEYPPPPDERMVEEKYPDEEDTFEESFIAGGCWTKGIKGEVEGKERGK